MFDFQNMRYDIGDRGSLYFSVKKSAYHSKAKIFGARERLCAHLRCTNTRELATTTEGNGENINPAGIMNSAMNASRRMLVARSAAALAARPAARPIALSTVAAPPAALPTVS